ncbi:hypothetical protein INR49_008932 [Caranx melampygus]|nr:hypothetical protein INR49_008932 [Caranx melampygus]
MGRRSQRGKRRGPADKRRGPGEKRRGQKEKRRCSEEKKEGVTVKRMWSGGKRRWDKKHYCVFCRRPQVKIARHLLRKHADQQEVMAASTLPTGSKQRHLLLEHLRCRGNYLHNIEVIRQGSGEIVPCRQPSEEVDVRNYLPCPLCLGFFLRSDLWKHQASCRRKLSSDPSSDPFTDPCTDSTAETTFDPLKTSREDTPRDPPEDTDPAGRTRTFETSSKRPMTSDPSGDQNVTSDPGLDRPKKRCRVQAAASRLLPISKAEGARSVPAGGEVSGLGCPDAAGRPGPGRLSLVLAAARKASGYRWSRPPLAVKTTLKTVCEIAIGESLQDGDWEAAAKTTDFYHMLGREWDNLGLVNPDPDTVDAEGGAKLKKRPVQPRIEKKSKESGPEPEPRPQVTSKTCSRPMTSTSPPESRLQTPVTVPVIPRKVRRRPWSSAEKEAVWRQLGVHVLVQSVPGKEVCQRCLDLEPVLRGRHWKDIKNQVHNQIQSQKKQQFHAQMDLQENHEHQSQDQQDQSQKKQQQHYQAETDQQDKDQKKQDYPAQMDHHDQGNIQNQKKLHYQIQMDHQDHLHIHKKQLCHTRLDHQDHIQTHKKQLYQLDQQTQGLQATLDQDTTLLTGTPYEPDGSHRGPGHSLVERDPIISPYPPPHRAPGPHMDQLLSRTAWTDESLPQNYPVSRQLARNLLPDAPQEAHNPIHTLDMSTSEGPQGLKHYRLRPGDRDSNASLTTGP